MQYDNPNLVGTLWQDIHGKYFLIIDIVFWYGRLEYLIQQVDTGNNYQNEAVDFFHYHTQIS